MKEKDFFIRCDLTLPKFIYDLVESFQPGDFKAAEGPVLGKDGNNYKGLTNHPDLQVIKSFFTLPITMWAMYHPADAVVIPHRDVTGIGRDVVMSFALRPNAAPTLFHETHASPAIFALHHTSPAIMNVHMKVHSVANITHERRTFQIGFRATYEEVIEKYENGTLMTNWFADDSFKTADFTPEDKVLLFVSGGVESTLLLTELNKLSLEVGFPLELWTVRNKVGYEETLEKILPLLPDNPNRTWVKDIENSGESNGTISPVLYRALTASNFTHVFTGANKNPDITHSHPAHRPTLEYISQFPKWHVPFHSMTKDQILKIYQARNLTELYKLTHSCTTQAGDGCGYCFQCCERKWAEERVTL